MYVLYCDLRIIDNLLNSLLHQADILLVCKERRQLYAYPNIIFKRASLFD